jgi:hypothetical protein
VANDRGVVARRPCERPAVTRLLLDVADDRTLGQGGDGKNVADAQACLLADVDELARVHALGRDESFRAKLVAVRVTEHDTGKGSTTDPIVVLHQNMQITCINKNSSPSRVVDDLLDETSKISVALGIVERPEAGRRNAVVRMRLENATALTLIADNATHCTAKNESRRIDNLQSGRGSKPLGLVDSLETLDPFVHSGSISHDRKNIYLEFAEILKQSVRDSSDVLYRQN